MDAARNTLDVTVTDDNNKTARDHAVHHVHPEIIKLLDEFTSMRSETQGKATGLMAACCCLCGKKEEDADTVLNEAQVQVAPAANDVTAPTLENIESMEASMETCLTTMLLVIGFAALAMFMAFMVFSFQGLRLDLPGTYVYPDDPVLSVIILMVPWYGVTVIFLYFCLLIVYKGKLGAKSQLGAVYTFDLVAYVAYVVVFFLSALYGSVQTARRNQDMSEAWGALPAEGNGTALDFQEWYDCCGWANTTDRAVPADCHIVYPSRPPCSEGIMPYVTGSYLTMTFISWSLTVLGVWVYVLLARKWWNYRHVSQYSEIS